MLTKNNMRASCLFICMLTSISFSLKPNEERLPSPCPILLSEPFLKTGFRAMGQFTANLLSWDTVKVVAAFTPLYIGSRYLDKDIHSHFYCHRHHHNNHQLPRELYHITNIGLPIIIIPLALMSLVTKDPPFKVTTTVFAFSLPLVYAIKKIAKLGKYKGGCRPPNQLFSRHKKFYGGCPSGHMAVALYMTSLFGLRHGAKFGVPLGIFTGLIALDFMVCNRHYLSQLVAGAALGTIYTIAAYKLAKKIDGLHNAECSLTMNRQGHPGIKVTYRF